MHQPSPQFIAIIKKYILQNSGKISIVDNSQEKAGFSEIDNYTSPPNATIFLFSISPHIHHEHEDAYLNGAVTTRFPNPLPSTAAVSTSFTPYQLLSMLHIPQRAQRAVCRHLAVAELIKPVHEDTKELNTSNDLLGRIQSAAPEFGWAPDLINIPHNLSTLFFHENQFARVLLRIANQLQLNDCFEGLLYNYIHMMTLRIAYKSYSDNQHGYYEITAYNPSYTNNCITITLESLNDFNNLPDKLHDSLLSLGESHRRGSGIFCLESRYNISVGYQEQCELLCQQPPLANSNSPTLATILAAFTCKPKIHLLFRTQEQQDSYESSPENNNPPVSNISMSIELFAYQPEFMIKLCREQLTNAANCHIMLEALMGYKDDEYMQLASMQHIMHFTYLVDHKNSRYANALILLLHRCLKYLSIDSKIKEGFEHRIRKWAISHNNDSKNKLAHFTYAVYMTLPKDSKQHATCLLENLNDYRQIFARRTGNIFAKPASLKLIDGLGMSISRTIVRNRNLRFTGRPCKQEAKPHETQPATPSEQSIRYY